MILSEKELPSTSVKVKKELKAHPAAPNCSLRARPLDLLYVVFFVTHIPSTLLLDLQAVYPHWLVPADSPLRSLATYFVSMTNDPVVGGVGGMFGEQFKQSMLWVACFMHFELFLQLPTFIYATYNLYYNRNLHVLYPLLTFYGASTATTTFPCIMVLLTTPATGAFASTFGPTLSDGQRWLLVGSYLPYFLIPLLIGVDMALRTSSLVSRGLKEIKREGKWD